MIILRVWQLWWLIRYKVRTTITGGGFVESNVTIAWVHDGKRVSVTSDPLSLLRLVPAVIHRLNSTPTKGTR